MDYISSPQMAEQHLSLIIVKGLGFVRDCMHALGLASFGPSLLIVD